jgi:hypothetical protein
MNRTLAACVWWVAAGVCAALCAAIWGYTVDDAYIVFRYARNLVEGHGPVFNVGERVEGFSSPLWLAVATIAEVLHLSVEHVCKALSMAAVIAMLWFIAGRMRTLLLTARLPLLLLAAYAPLHVAVVCGLETAVNAAIVVCLLFAAYEPIRTATVRERRTSRPDRAAPINIGMSEQFGSAAGGPLPDGRGSDRDSTISRDARRGMAAALGGHAVADELSSPALAFWGCLALLCRPENGLIVGVHGLYLWCVRPDQRRRLYVAAAVWFIVGALLTLARFAYYGALLPNTAVAKVSVDAAFGAGGQWYCLSWLGQYWWLPLLGVSAFAARPIRRMVVNAWLLIAAQVAFVFFVGGDWMPQWRFLLPASVLLVILGCYGLDAILLLARRLQAVAVWKHGMNQFAAPAKEYSLHQPEAPAKESGSSAPVCQLLVVRPSRQVGFGPSLLRLFIAARAAPAAACVLGIALLLVTQFWHFRAVRWYLDYYQRQLDVLADGPVRYLADRAGGADLVVARDIGILGYRTRCRILDVVGLTDPHVARSSGYRHRDNLDSEYVFARRPDYLMLQTGNDRESDPIPLDNIARALMRDGRFSQYRFCRRWNLPGRHYCEIYSRLSEPAGSPTAMIEAEE